MASSRMVTRALFIAACMQVAACFLPAQLVGFSAGRLGSPVSRSADQLPSSFEMARQLRIRGFHGRLHSFSRKGIGSRLAYMAAGDSTWVRPPPRGSRDIVFGGIVESSVPVQPRCDPGCDLKSYMQLPADQYVLIPLPNKAKLERLDAEHFGLQVPELQFFNVWVRPKVVARVKVTEEGVAIEANECKLEGSSEVERLDLNSKFDFSIRIDLTWREDRRGLRSLMLGRSEINVWVDPPQIFRLMFPRSLMEQTGNAVLRTSLNLLQTTFMDGLGKDYGRWAVDETYRAARRAASTRLRTPPAATTAAAAAAAHAGGAAAAPSAAAAAAAPSAAMAAPPSSR